MYLTDMHYKKIRTPINLQFSPKFYPICTSIRVLWPFNRDKSFVSQVIAVAHQFSAIISVAVTCLWRRLLRIEPSFSNDLTFRGSRLDRIGIVRRGCCEWFHGAVDNRSRVFHRNERDETANYRWDPPSLVLIRGNRERRRPRLVGENVRHVRLCVIDVAWRVRRAMKLGHRTKLLPPKTKLFREISRRWLRSICAILRKPLTAGSGRSTIAPLVPAIFKSIK